MPAQSPRRVRNLEQQRKRAKDLLKACRAGDPSAAIRLVHHLPRLADRAPDPALIGPVSLSEAQLVVAREAGFPTWPRMKHSVEAASSEHDSRLNRLLEAAAVGDHSRVEALGREGDALTSTSLHAACALGASDDAIRLMARVPDSVTTVAGAAAWTPLLYLCCSRVAGLAQWARPAARVAIARALLDHGADPTDATEDARQALGRRTALAGAVGIVQDANLAEILIAAGAAKSDLLWKMAIVDEAVRQSDLACLRLLLPLKPPSWELRGALATAIERQDLEAAKLLLEAGADPNASGVWGRIGSSLHHAVLAGCRPDLIDALLEAGGDPRREDRDGRTPAQVARRVGHVAALGRLRATGVRVPDTAVDRLISAAVSGITDRSTSESVQTALERSDHQMVAWALRTGHSQAVPRLLALGLDPNVPDDDGKTALGLAAATGNTTLVGTLIEAGADVSRADLDARRPLDHAATVKDIDARRATVARLIDSGAEPSQMRQFPTGDAPLDEDLRRLGAVERPDLAEHFETAVDAIVSGDLSLLDRLLVDEPSLVTSRSPRPHRATLLHYVGSNGVEDRRQRTPPNAVAILDRLLEAGAEPDALACTYGGGPAQTTLSLLVSSDWPAKVGLQGELARRLCEAGADPDGLDQDGLPMATAVSFRKVQAVDALAPLARIDNALFAAAAGRVDVLEREIGPDGRLRPGAGHCRVPWLRMSRDPRLGGEQALIVAARFGRLDTVRWLVERGVAPGGGAEDNTPAIHEAAFGGHESVVEYLLEQGADPGVRERQFKSTAIGWAAEGKHQAIIELILRHHEPDLYDSVDLGLVDHVRRHLDRDPSKVDAPDGRGGLLRYSAWMGRLELVRLLLERGADTSVTDDQKRTPLDLAKERGHEEVVALLDSWSGRSSC